MPDLLYRPAGELAGLLRAGECSSRELVEASLRAIEARNDQLGAFTTLDAERALHAADQVAPGDERPFAGVPIAIKDLFTSVAGIRQSQGSDFFGDFTPDHDTSVVRRLKAAGFVIVGVTKSPEFGILPVTEPRRFGPARNPWDTGRTPGGSSGGSAAAVAGGLVPIAHGSDGGGSLRIPAACCGLVGLKASRGRISHAPELGDSFLTTDGVLSRTIGDTAALLDLLAGPEPGDATWAPPTGEPFAATAAAEPGRLRVAVTVAPPIDAPVDPVCAGAVREAAELLASLGHEVVEADPPWFAEGLFPTFSAAWAALISFSISVGTLINGREPTARDVEPLSWALYEQGMALRSTHYLGAMAQLQAFARGIVGFFADHDVLLTPALAQRPVPIGTIDACADEPLRTFAASGRFTPFTAPLNVTGQPAISVPLFHGEDGLPLAVQLVGPPTGEGLLLSLAAQLEAARPWAERRAPQP